MEIMKDLEIISSKVFSVRNCGWAVSLIQVYFPHSQSHTQTVHVFIFNYMKGKIEQVGHKNDDALPRENCIANNERKA